VSRPRSRPNQTRPDQTRPHLSSQPLSPSPSLCLCAHCCQSLRPVFHQGSLVPRTPLASTAACARLGSDTTPALHSISRNQIPSDSTQPDAGGTGTTHPAASVRATRSPQQRRLTFYGFRGRALHLRIFGPVVFAIAKRRVRYVGFLAPSTHWGSPIIAYASPPVVSLVVGHTPASVVHEQVVVVAERAEPSHQNPARSPSSGTPAQTSPFPTQQNTCHIESPQRHKPRSAARVAGPTVPKSHRPAGASLLSSPLLPSFTPRAALQALWRSQFSECTCIHPYPTHAARLVRRCSSVG
jgi:hypothetical protein